MIDVLILALICIIVFFTGYGVYSYFWGKEDYEWRKNLAAREHWAKMLEDDK